MICLGNIEDFPLESGTTIYLDSKEIALFRTSSGEFYALNNQSPHRKGGVLTEGLLSDHFVFCPVYDLKIDLKTGEVQKPDTGFVEIYPLSTDGNLLYLQPIPCEVLQ